MKILNVNISLDAKTGGGTAERTFQLTRWLNELGLDCKVLTLSIGGADERGQVLNKENIISLPCLNKRFYIPLPSITRIRNAVQDVDLIHLMSHWTLLNAIVYLVVRYYKKPYVLCPAGALSYIGRSKVLKKIYNYIIGNKIIRNSAYCIAITQNEILDICGNGVQKSKIIHIPNGISEKEYLKHESDNFRHKYDISEKKIILFVGRLNPIKGVDLLFDAFCDVSDQLPQYQLVIAGPDEGMGRDLRKTALERNLTDRIKFIGYLDFEYKSSAYHASSLLVVPSRREAMSIVALEAGISGTPVLMTNRCGFDEVENIGGGVVVDATTEGIGKGLLDLLSSERQLHRMGERLKSYVKQNYLWADIAKAHLDLFYKVVKS